VRSFRDLKVYQTGFESAMEIFELPKRFPYEERFSLTDQIRRSSRSVTACIAEAWRRRRYPASFINKLSEADTEAAETTVWLDYALRCGYMAADVHAPLRDCYEHINAQLTKMMDRPEDWCRSADR
jgi:four helix bundle protein